MNECRKVILEQGLSLLQELIPPSHRLSELPRIKTHETNEPHPHGALYGLTEKQLLLREKVPAGIGTIHNLRRGTPCLLTWQSSSFRARALIHTCFDFSQLPAKGCHTDHDEVVV